MNGYLRSDGRKGIRNVTVIVYLVECAHHVARMIAQQFEPQEVQVIGFPGCYPNQYAQSMLERLCTHPNVGAALLVSLGCEGFNKLRLRDIIVESGRPVELLTIQGIGGTRATIQAGSDWIRTHQTEYAKAEKVPMGISDLVVGTICGGSDGTSGLTANPVIGHAFDALVERGATCIFEETGELIGCEQHMADRAETPGLGSAIVDSVAKAARYYEVLGYPSFAPGNADGGLTTIEEKSMGAYAKSGRSTISGLIKPGDVPPKGGLYLLDVVPDGDVRFGFPNIVDNAEIAELIACGSHMILFSTGRGSVVGSAISPVIKICANSATYSRMEDDMDINAGRILDGRATIDEVGSEVFDLVRRVGSGAQSCSESLGHTEFILTYKTFEPIGPSCLPQT